MYFSPQPKMNRKDLFNFVHEYNELKKSVERYQLNAIIGLRRTGKTSLSNVVYSELDGVKVFLDARELLNKSIEEVLLARLGESVKNRDMKAYLAGLIESVGISGISLKKGKGQEVLSMTLEKIAKKERRVYIFIDEVQLLKPLNLDNFIAYAIDRIPNVSFVLTGSEVGVMEKFCGREESSALYGRAKKIIKTRRLSKEEARDFFKKGAQQSGITIAEEEIERVISRIDGILGWLSLYGWYRIEMNEEEALKKVVEEGKKIVASEIRSFIENKQMARSKYLLLFRYLSTKDMSWSELKRMLQLETKARVSDNRLAEYLKNMLDYSFIEKSTTYSIADPLIKDAVVYLGRHK